MTIRFGSKTFATPTATPFPPVKFAVITDIHLDIKGKNDMDSNGISSKCIAQTVKDLNKEKNLTFVMFPGDLLQNGEVENAREIKRHLDQLAIPYYVLAGNHDYVPANPEKRREGFTYMTIEEFVKFFSGHGYDNSGKRYYSLQIIPGLRLIALDGCLPQEPEKWGGILPDHQLKWLDDQLTEQSDNLNLIFLHHNFLTWSSDELPEESNQWFTLDNSKNARKILERQAHAAPVAISGHRHIGLNFREENGVTYFVTPPFCSQPHCYTVFTISNKMIAWETVLVDISKLMAS
jgi:3',5'-cyclic-AMP phosphodiesterase